MYFYENEEEMIGVYETAEMREMKKKYYDRWRKRLDVHEVIPEEKCVVEKEEWSPPIQDPPCLWIECISHVSNPGKKYYYCPVTHEVSWNTPLGNIQLIPYVLPNEERASCNSQYLQIYSPPAPKNRKQIRSL